MNSSMTPAQSIRPVLFSADDGTEASRAADFRALGALSVAAPADFSVPAWAARDFVDMMGRSIPPGGKNPRCLRGAYVVFTPDGRMAEPGSRVALRWGRKAKP